MRTASKQAAAAIAIAELPLVVTSPAAVAEELSDYRTLNFTFTSLHTGEEVTCPVGVGSFLEPKEGDPTFNASAVTAVDPQADPQEKCAAGVQINVRYRDGNNVQVFSSSQGQRATYWSASNATRRFVAQHRVIFNDCHTDCVLTVTTRPK